MNEQHIYLDIVTHILLDESVLVQNEIGDLLIQLCVHWILSNAMSA